MTGRLVPLILLFSIISVVFSQSARADLFTVSSIFVDARADSATLARDQALREARAAGFQRLLQRLTQREDHGSLPQLSDADIEPMVLSLQVRDEKTSPGRYLAALSIQFDPAPVRELLNFHQLAYTEARALPVLVVPVLTEDGAPAIWSDPNPWLDAWAAIDASQRHVPPVVPFGDIEDVVLLTAEQAVLRDTGALGALAGRYNTETAIVAEAIPSIDRAAGVLRVTVKMQSAGPDNYPGFTLNFEGAASEDPLPFLEQVADQVLAEVEAHWKATTIESFSEEFQLTALVPFQDMADWLDISARLGGVNLVRRQQLSALTVRDAVIEITHVGEIELFGRALARAGLQLEEQPDGFWILSRTGASQQ